MVSNEEKVKAAKTGDNLDACISLQNDYDSTSLRQFLNKFIKIY